MAPKSDFGAPPPSKKRYNKTKTSHRFFQGVRKLRGGGALRIKMFAHPFSHRTFRGDTVYFIDVVDFIEFCVWGEGRGMSKLKNPGSPPKTI